MTDPCKTHASPAFQTLDQRVADLESATPGVATSWGGITGTLADQSDLATALSGKQDAGSYAASNHSHAISGVTGLQTALDGKQAAGSYEAGSAVANHVAAADPHTQYQKESEKGSANGYASLGADGKVPSGQLPSSGSDPWTVLSLSSDFTTTSATAVDVTGMGFTPSANTKYMFEAVLMLRTATATVNPRVGWAWPTGMTDGVAQIDTSQTATTRLMANGNTGAALLGAVGGLPNTTQSWPSTVWGLAVAGSSPSGNLRLQLASETAGTTVTIKAGSYLRYRSY